MGLASMSKAQQGGKGPEGMHQPTPRPDLTLRSIFFSPDETRLRAGWRLLIQTILLLALLFCFTFPILLPYLMTGRGDLSGIPYILATEVVEALAVTLSIFLARRF